MLEVAYFAYFDRIIFLFAAGKRSVFLITLEYYR
jgi:hypothetical protein